MLETLDLTATIDEDVYKERKREIKFELSRLQQEAQESGLGVIVVFEGWQLAGKSHCIRALADPLDPRHFKTHVIYPPTGQEKVFPFVRRYALRLPPRGQFGFFFRSWYYHVLDERVRGGEEALEHVAALEEIRLYEKSLADDGYLIIKFWLHISEEELRRRRKKAKKDGVALFTSPDDPRQHQHYDQYLLATEDMIAATSTDYARWYPIPATDLKFARIAVATRIINRVKDELALRSQPAPAVSEVLANVTHLEPVDGNRILSKVDLSQTISKDEYEKKVSDLQRQIVFLQQECVEKRRAVTFVFEGWDAAGKGGCIRRLTRTLDPRYYEAISIAAPRGEEKDHHYLWRFWRHIPPAGAWHIFDRSWYGRVLVERVEGFATIPAWRRAYTEINDFEVSLVESGNIMLKFWLHISKEEQLRRFQERERIEYKRYKITEEDWRNREKWELYEHAAEDMFSRTSTPAAPWTVVPANDKLFARVAVLEKSVSHIRESLTKKLSRLRKSF